MKIGILSTCEKYSWAGTEEVWYQFAKHALTKGHQVVLGAHELVCGSTQVTELAAKGLDVAARKPRSPIRLYLLKENFWPEMTLLQSCDVVLINSGSLFDALNLPWINRFVRRLSNQAVKLIFFCHFCAESLPATDHSQVAIQEFVECIDSWVFVSEHNRQLAQRQLALNFKNSSVVMNGPRLNLDEPLPWPSGSTTFGCVARLETRWKGHDVLLKCLSGPHWQARDWKLNIYGSGPDEAYIRRLIDHFELQDRVQMPGYVRDIEQVWSECHAMVLASHGEGTPLAVLEAMMCGRPTFTTDVGGNLEILEPEVSGFIADCATPRSFGQTLERAWASRDHWQQMGIASYEKAKELASRNPAARLLKLVEQFA